MIDSAAQDEPRAVPRGSCRRRRFRQARSAVAAGLLAFAALQIVLAVASESWLPELRDPPFATKLKHLQLRTARVDAPPATVVMLGSSLTAFGFRGQMLEAPLSKALGRPAIVFNLGVYGAGPVTELVYLRRLLRQGAHPDLLLVEVFPKMLDEDKVREEIACLPAHRLLRPDLALVKGYGGAAFAGLAGDWWETMAWPIYAFRRTILSGTLPVLLPPLARIEWNRAMDDSGWLCLRSSPSFMTPEFRGHLRDALRRDPDWERRWRLAGPGIQALHELLALARREGIRTAMVLMPEGPVLRSLCAPPNRREIRALVEGLRKEFSCSLVDADQWLEEDAFSDSHHLLPDGASRFTERLGRELILPLLCPVASSLPGSGRLEAGLESCPTAQRHPSLNHAWFAGHRRQVSVQVAVQTAHPPLAQKCLPCTETDSDERPNTGHR